MALWLSSVTIIALLDEGAFHESERDAESCII